MAAEKEVDKIKCSCCGKTKSSSTEFYKSNSILNKNTGRLCICKQCVWKIYDDFVKESNGDELSAIYRLCRLLDFPYLEEPFKGAVKESERSGRNLFKLYIKNLNSLNQYSSYTFENGENIKTETEDSVEIQEIEENLTDRDRQNEEDVVRILGYDPFINENKKDRKFLFNRFVDMLTDDVLDDNVKLMSVISIVKGFNQLEYIDMAIAKLTSNIDKLNENNGGIKSLIDTKKNLTTTILKACEDNGISSKFNTNKSAGAGTLSGIMKKLFDIGLEEVEVNLFDIQTSEGMKQVADMSNESIKSQLVFDENDYTEMIAFQRDELLKLRREKESFEENSRKLKIKIKEYENILKELNR